jgi:hypothetical protein
MDPCMLEHRDCCIDLGRLFDQVIVVEGIHHSLVEDNLKRDIINLYQLLHRKRVRTG